MGLDLTSQCGPHTNKVKFQSGAPHAAVCGHCAIPRCLDRSQPLLWPTFSVWCLSLFIKSVTVAQKPEMAAEGRGAQGEREGASDGRTSCWICVSVLNGACHMNGWSHAIFWRDAERMFLQGWMNFYCCSSKMIWNRSINIKAAYYNQ